jgi:hypothetical protein
VAQGPALVHSFHRHRREYSPMLVFYWSHAENILTVSSSIGHTQRIFSHARLLLVTQREYSHRLIFYWSHTENILTCLSSIGPTQVQVAHQTDDKGKGMHFIIIIITVIIIIDIFIIITIIIIIIFSLV